MSNIEEQLKWEIVCTGNEIEISDTTVKIKELYGGFGQGQKILTVPQIAKLHCDNPNDKKEITKKIARINELINNNIENFIDKEDIIDLKKHVLICKRLKEQRVYTQAQIGNTNKIYVLSKKGYCKLYNIMRIKNHAIKKHLLNEYFQCNTFMINDDIVYREIDFKNKFLKRINIILNNILENGWNIDNLKLKNIIQNKFYLPEHQYSVCNNKYQIDFFFLKLKIICEFDEFRHKYQEKEDEKRMKDIIEYLSYKDGDCYYNNDKVLCEAYSDTAINIDNSNYTIIRIKDNDKDGVEKLIGVVLGKIFSLC